MKQRKRKEGVPTFGGGVHIGDDRVVVTNQDGYVISIHKDPDKGVKEVVNDYCKDKEPTTG